jgi:hypothetical protein
MTRPVSTRSRFNFLRESHHFWCISRRKSVLERRRQVDRGSSQHDERGAIGGLEGLAFGVLLFAFGTLMVVNAWAVVDGKMTASAAAREATRSYVEATNEREALTNANNAAMDAVNGRPNAHTLLAVTPLSNRGFGRCEEVTATVRIDIPRVRLPLIGGTGGTFPVSATHTEVIDPYRSGLASTATCA